MEDEIRALLVRILKPPQAPFKEFRADGWPFCPKCEEEELYSYLMLSLGGRRPSPDYRRVYKG